MTKIPERALQRAITMLPPEIAMALECARDAEGDTPAGAALDDMLEHIISCGLDGRPLTDAPCEPAIVGNTLVLKDGVTLTGEGDAAELLLSGAKALPKEMFPLNISVGLGNSAVEAEQSCDIALASPRDGERTKAEKLCLRRINALAIGPLGLGGYHSCLSVVMRGTGRHIAVRYSTYLLRRARI